MQGVVVGKTAGVGRAGQGLGGDEGAFGNSVLSVRFSVNLKLLSKIKSIDKKKKVYVKAISK